MRNLRVGKLYLSTSTTLTTVIAMNAGRVKPLVGIVYSDDCLKSHESKNLAFYFAGLLSTSG